MVIKVYISGISGNKEVKKRQQRVLLILDSKNVKYEVIDIAEPGAEEAKDFMQNSSTHLGATIGDPNPRHALPPQIFNDDVYCGDYDQFDMANEVDEMETFLKLEPNSLNDQTPNTEIKLKNGDLSIDEKINKVLGVKTDDEEVPKEQEEKKDENEKENDKESEAEDKKDESEGNEAKVDNENEDKPEEKEKYELEEKELEEDVGAGGDKAEEDEADKEEGEKDEKIESEKESSPEKSE